MGSLSNVVGMIPGFNADMIPKGQEKASTERIKKFMCMMDSMTKDELDCIKPLDESRVLRIAKGAGANPKELLFLLGEHKRFSKMVANMGKMNLDGLDADAMKKNPNAMMQKLQSALDPKIVQQMGGMGNLMNMAQQFAGGQGGGMADMMKGMTGGGGGAPGAGGAPDMAKMM